MKSKSKMNSKIIAMLIACFLLPQISWAQSTAGESPNAGAMVGDLLIARPIGLIMTVGGVAAFIVSLPFTILAGHASEAAEVLMVGPARTTFMRCLGCTTTGYTYKDTERRKDTTED